MDPLEAAQGPWYKPSAVEPDIRVDFDVDSAGQRFAFRAMELLFLNPDDGDIETLIGELWDPATLAADVDLAREAGDNIMTCDLGADELAANVVALEHDGDNWVNIDALNAARLIKIKFSQAMLDRSNFAGHTMPQIVDRLKDRAGALKPSLNTIYFSAVSNAGSLWGSPVMWSGVEGAPVMWSGVGGAPVMWSGVGGAPVMWSGVGGAPVMWSGVGGAPVMWSGVGGAPVMWSGVEGAPVMWSGVGGAPVMWSGVGGACGCGSCCCDEDRPWRKPQPDDLIFTTARAALRPAYADRLPCAQHDGAAELDEEANRLLGPGTCRVVILDTGLVDGTVPAANGINGLENHDEHNANAADGDIYVDAAAGHGTFIAGLIRRLAPEATIEVGRVLSSYGDGADCVISTVIRHLADSDVPGILNLSFVSYTPNDEPPPVLKLAIEHAQSRGWIVVAAAGNDATCRPAWPAALPGVVSVGATAPWGPAWFTNYGTWVRACAPGVDIVSNWYDFSDLGDEELKRTDSDPANHANGWAVWSGTSFSAPIVAAALARDVISAGWPPNDVDELRERRQEIVDDLNTSPNAKTTALIALDDQGPIFVGGDRAAGDMGGTDPRMNKEGQLKQAVERVIDDPRLLRVPCLGTIVNDHL